MQYVVINFNDCVNASIYNSKADAIAAKRAYNAHKYNKAIIISAARFNKCELAYIVNTANAVNNKCELFTIYNMLQSIHYMLRFIKHKERSADLCSGDACDSNATYYELLTHNFNNFARCWDVLQAMHM